MKFLPFVKQLTENPGFQKALAENGKVFDVKAFARAMADLSDWKLNEEKKATE